VGTEPYRPDEVVGEILEYLDPVTLRAVAAELRRNS
jgi:hypothetical protein